MTRFSSSLKDYKYFDSNFLTEFFWVGDWVWDGSVFKDGGKLKCRFSENIKKMEFKCLIMGGI